MKRSEAIAILKDILYEASGHVAEEINPEWLLHNIEKRLEMLPPERVVDYSPFMTANAWEPENEEK